MTERFSSLQILRGLAAWSVVLHHFAQFFSGPVGPFGFFLRYGQFGVDVFFVLSGFVMYVTAIKPDVTGRVFLVNRFMRVAPVYWFYTAVLVVCLALFPLGFAYTDYTPATLAASLFFIPHHNPTGLGEYPTLTVGWTLNFEMFFYVLLSACLLINKRKALLICAVVLVLLPLVYPKGAIFSRVASSFLLYEFLLGMLLAHAVRRRLFNHWTFFAALLVTIPSAYLFATHPAFKLLLAGSLVAMVLYAEPYLHDHRSRFFVLLGDQSYSTYLAHPIIMGVLLHFTGPVSGVLMIPMLAFIAVTTHYASSLSYRFVERGPVVASFRNSLLAPL